MKLTLLAVVLFVLTSCASEQGFREIADSWIGASESDLVSEMGPPSNVYLAPNGDRILTYSRQGSMVLPGTAPSYQSTIYGSSIYSRPIGGTPPATVNLSCELSFIIRDDRIKNWSSRGTSCVG